MSIDYISARSCLAAENHSLLAHGRRCV